MSAEVLRFGSASTDITPDSAVYLGGYGIGPVRKCSGISSRLYARAIAIEIAGKAIAVASIDTHGLLRSYKDGPGHREIEQTVKEQRPILSGLVCASTHSHSAPDSTGVWGGLPRAELERIADGASRAVVGAIDSLMPAKLSLGAVDASELLRNQCGFAPHDEVDGALTVISARQESGGLIGRLVHFAAHPTVSSGREISSDWCGALAAALDQGSDGPTVVVPGAIGRTQPAIRGDGSATAVNAFASAVLEKVVEAEANSNHLVVSDIEFASETVSLPLTNPLLQVISKLIGRAEPTNETVVSAAKFGPLVIVGFPGEAYPNLADTLRDEFRRQTILPVSLAGDQIGYLIYPANSYRRILRDAYRNDNSYFCPSPKAGEALLAAAKRLIRGF